MPRARKPLHLHELMGTRPEHSAPDTPAFAPSRPKMPKDLCPVAQAEWKRLVKELMKRGTMTRVDSSALEIYAVTFARWKACVAQIERDGPCVEVSWTDQQGIEHTKIVEHPASKIAGRLENSMRAMLKEFSATPASREKTRPTQPPPAADVFPDGSIGWLEQRGAEPEEPTQ